MAFHVPSLSCQLPPGSCQPLGTTWDCPLPPKSLEHHAGITGVVSLKAIGMSLPCPMASATPLPTQVVLAIPGGVAGSGWQGLDHTLTPGQGSSSPGSSLGLLLCHQRHSAAKAPQIYVYIYISIHLYLLTHRQRMVNSFPEASNVQHLGKYNLELIGKVWFWDRLQPLTPLQPSPPLPHTSGHPLPSANGLSVTSKVQDPPGPSLPLAATLQCTYIRCSHIPCVHRQLPGSANTCPEPVHRMQPMGLPQSTRLALTPSALGGGQGGGVGSQHRRAHCGHGVPTKALSTAHTSTPCARCELGCQLGCKRLPLSASPSPNSQKSSAVLASAPSRIRPHVPREERSMVLEGAA